MIIQMIGIDFNIGTMIVILKYTNVYSQNYDQNQLNSSQSLVFILK